MEKSLNTNLHKDIIKLLDWDMSEKAKIELANQIIENKERIIALV